MTDRSLPDARELIRDWQGPIYNYALCRVANEADAADLCQDIFLAALKGRRALQDPSKLRSWLFAIAHRKVAAYHYRRQMRQQKERVAALSAESGESAGPPEELECAERAALVQAQLRGLPGELQEVLVLRYFQGLSQAEVSAVLGRPRTTVQSQIKKGLARLRIGLSAAALVPELEFLLRGLPHEPVPLSLTLALVQLEARFREAAIAIGVAYTKLKTGLAAILVLCFGAVVALESWTPRLGSEARGTPILEAASSRPVTRSARRGERRAPRRDRSSETGAAPLIEPPAESEDLAPGGEDSVGESLRSGPRGSARDADLAAIFDRLMELSRGAGASALNSQGDPTERSGRRFLELRSRVQRRRAEIIQYAARRLEASAPHERALILKTLRLLLRECRRGPVDGMDLALESLLEVAEDLPAHEARALLRLAAEASPPEYRGLFLPKIVTLARSDAPGPRRAGLNPRRKPQLRRPPTQGHAAVSPPLRYEAPPIAVRAIEVHGYSSQSSAMNPRS